jgi:hypothetical protein
MSNEPIYVPPPPKKERPWRRNPRPWIIGGVVALLLIGGIAALQESEPVADSPAEKAADADAVSPSFEPSEAEPSGIEAVDLPAVIGHVEEAVRLGRLSAAASQDLNLEASAEFTEQAAAEWYAVSSLWEPVPEMAELTFSIAEHTDLAAQRMHEANEALLNGDAALATQLIRNSTREIQAATAEIEEANRLTVEYAEDA